LNIVKSFRTSALLVVATLFAVAASAQTSTWKIDPVHSGIEFKVRHLGVSNVRGTFTHPTGTVILNDKDITKSSVEATIDATSVSTNEAARDKHLKSPAFFDIDKNPTMAFKSTSVYKEGGKLLMKGDLTLAGVTKPVVLVLDGPSAPQTDAKGMTRSGFSASGVLSRKDFNFGANAGPANAAIGDEVSISIDIEMDKQP
jgi:polyisoprenoid-binding protein YceI